MSHVLGTVHMWHLRGNRSKVVDLIVRHFSASELLDASKEICKAVQADVPVARRESGQRSAAEAQAIDLLEHIGELESQGKLPVIVVPSTVLAKVPFSTLLNSDDVAVSARLESLERCMKSLTESVTKIAANNTGTFAGARARVNSSSREGTVRAGGHPQVLVTSPRNEEGGTTWAGVATKGNGGQGLEQLQLPHQAGRDRLGSDSDKRKREEEFTYQGRPRNRKVEVGKSTVTVDEGGEAAPLEYYVGNTTPRATPEIIKAVLVKSATKLEKDLQVLEVTCLTYGFESPRSKSWKVKVPYKYKELMEQNDLYPEGWTYRKFFAPRSANQGRGSSNKKVRHDDHLVDDILRDSNHQVTQQGDQQVHHRADSGSSQTIDNPNGGGQSPT